MMQASTMCACVLCKFVTMRFSQWWYPIIVYLDLHDYQLFAATTAAHSPCAAQD